MGEPPITLRAVHDNGPLAMPVTRIVVHATSPGTGYPKASEAGSALGTAHYFQTPAAGGSAHYCEDVETETHCVPDDVEAWGAPPNPHSLHVEICADVTYTREQWLSPQVWPAVLRAAARVAELCGRFTVPKVKVDAAALLAGAHGVCGHVDVSTAWHQTNHTDPGPFFPWPEFMAAVNRADTPSRTVQEDTNMTVIQPGGEAVIIKGVGHSRLRVACDFDPQTVRLAFNTTAGFASWPGAKDYVLWVAASTVSYLDLPAETDFISVQHKGAGEGGKTPRPVTVDTCPAG